MSSGQAWWADAEEEVDNFLADPAFIQWALFSGAPDIDLILYGTGADGKRFMKWDDRFWHIRNLISAYRSSL